MISDSKLTVSVTGIISNIADFDEEELQEAETINGSVSQFIEAFEQQLDIVKLDEGQDAFMITSSNVAVQVIMIHRFPVIYVIVTPVLCKRSPHI